MSDKEACDIVTQVLGDCVSQESGDRVAAALAAEALVRASLDAGTMDNVTAIVGLLKWT